MSESVTDKNTGQKPVKQKKFLCITNLLCLKIKKLYITQQKNVLTIFCQIIIVNIVVDKIITISMLTLLMIKNRFEFLTNKTVIYTNICYN